MQIPWSDELTLHAFSPSSQHLVLLTRSSRSEADSGISSSSNPPCSSAYEMLTVTLAFGKDGTDVNTVSLDLPHIAQDLVWHPDGSHITILAGRVTNPFTPLF